MRKVDGREGGEIRVRIRRHMLSVPSTPSSSSLNRLSSFDCFLKDGRKISVGDCALFKPAQDSPPFVGIIRCLTSDKQNYSTFSVNWLYRPAEVILQKGVALEAAPNEVFYSFHRDEIPAASLLHPCKVAFLPKGVELPAGVSSFVCRRVYDITNKCLWWLTDQNYIDELQQEVDQLLHKTRIEMHASPEQQHGVRSPKPVNGSAATSPLKQSPDSVQNSSSNFSFQTKGKKRDRGDHPSESVKRERSSRSDDRDSGLSRSDSKLNLEISKIAERGGLVDTEGVARLVRLMQPEKSERKMNLCERSMLAGVIAATDKFDCLNQFVQLKGLPVMDEWLQEIHKGKIDDLGNLKDRDRTVEDFLLVLLRALDKLPVNLNALQMCNIGKSVNHLRSHKNSEIQKKARTLVDTWKKRVEVEMNMNDARSGPTQGVPWTCRSRDSSYGGNRHSGGSSEAAIRSSVTHPSTLKSTSVKLVQGESKSKSVSQSNARSALSPTSATCNSKDGQSRVSANGGSSEPLQTVVREEKSSSSSQSHTNSQCSSDHAKNMASFGKEDARRSTAGSRSSNKTSGSARRHQKSANGPTSVIQKETATYRSSPMARSSVVDKVPQNHGDGSALEGNNNKLIVKIPNRAQLPAQGIAGAPVDDSSCKNSGASSPALSDKQDQSDACLRGKHESYQASEIDASSASVRQRPNDTRRLSNFSTGAGSPARSEIKLKKANDASFSSMNALVESCVKFSEASAPMSAGDDVGMNLLASVAAGEISRSSVVSPAASPHRKPVTADDSSSNYSGNKELLSVDNVTQQGVPTDSGDSGHHTIDSGIPKVNDVGTTKHLGTGNDDIHQNEEGCLRSNGMSEEQVSTAGRSVADTGVDVLNGKDEDAKDESLTQLPIACPSGNSHVDAAVKVEDLPLNNASEQKVLRDSGCPLLKDNDVKNNVSTEPQSNCLSDQISNVAPSLSEPMDRDEKPTVVPAGASQNSVAAKASLKAEKGEGDELCEGASKEGKGSVREADSSLPGKQEDTGVLSADVAEGTDYKDGNLDTRISATQVSSSTISLSEDLHSSPKESDIFAVEGKKTEDTAAVIVNATSSAGAGGSDVDTKLGFDLNEGLNVDEVKSTELGNIASGPCPSNVCSANPLQVPLSSASSSLPASITVAAAAKGPFVPVDDLLRNKRELGWKGSAATSAFRPAEPRNVMEVPLSSSKSPLPDVTALKQARQPLDIDLNVADESCGQETYFKNDTVCGVTTTASLRSCGGLDLDLNRADEAPDIGPQSASNSQRIEVSSSTFKPSLSSIFPNGESSSARNFDLNDGPAMDEAVEETSQTLPVRGSISLQPSFGPRYNTADAGSLFSWYPPGPSYSVSVSPSALPDREAFPIVGMGGGLQRVMAGPTSSLSFNPDVYRGSVLSSSPAMPFQSGQFQYPVFPFGTSFPLPTSALAGGPSGYMEAAASGQISAMPSQLVGNAASIPFQYPHAYVVSRPILDVSNNGAMENNQKRGKQGLDLNSGPGGLDLEGKDMSLPAASRQVPTIISQQHTEEQARMYSMGGLLKRKEPEGGWNMDKLNYKQSSWR